MKNAPNCLLKETRSQKNLS